MVAGGDVLSREDLPVVCECFELERIAAGVEEEHRVLLARLPFETDMGFDHEGHTGGE